LLGVHVLLRVGRRHRVIGKDFAAISDVSSRVGQRLALLFELLRVELLRRLLLAGAFNHRQVC
jgi:hypothetical protein